MTYQLFRNGVDRPDPLPQGRTGRACPSRVICELSASSNLLRGRAASGRSLLWMENGRALLGRGIWYFIQLCVECMTLDHTCFVKTFGGRDETNVIKILTMYNVL